MTKIDFQGGNFSTLNGLEARASELMTKIVGDKGKSIWERREAIT
jgi:hypothetical protein